MKKSIEKSTELLKVLALAGILAILVPSVLNAQSGKSNFSGTWAMNADKSSSGNGGFGGGQGGPRMGGDMTVTQEANLLTVDRTRPGRDGAPTKTTMKYTLDGKESVNPSQRGDSKSVATWSPDGKNLTIATTRSFDMNGETMTMKSTEEWSLTDPKTLSVKSTSTTPNGDMTSTMVYDKK
jgi:hypothetical protein